MNATASWVARIDASAASGLAALRLWPGLEVAPVADTIWLRGPVLNEALALALQKVPGLRRFSLLADGQLIVEGARVPQGRLESTHWRPLREWLPVALPGAIGAAPAGGHAKLCLVRSAAELPANAVLTDLSSWQNWADNAAEIRLRRLRFAAAWDGRVWIEGTPPPAVSGQRFHLREGVALPCGFQCAPNLEAGVLRRWLALADGDTAFAHPSGQWEILRAEQFVPALRSAVRLTTEALHHG